MRRRRRHSTQTIRKKNFNTPGMPPSQRRNDVRGSRSRWPMILFIILVVIVAGSLYYSAELVQYFAVSKEEQTTSVERQNNQPENEQPAQTKNKPQDSQRYTPIERKIQVEVLNGCGEKGVASIFENFLKDKGFDVVNTDNYREKGRLNWNVAKTFVADQTGNRDYAEQIAESLGIDDEQVTSFNNPSPICDVQVVIGKDFKSIEAFRNFSN